MLSDTLTTALASYAIGPKIRTMRLSRKLGLTQLGEHTGLSPALLSKIERGEIFPTLPNLLPSLWCSVWDLSISSDPMLSARSLLSSEKRTVSDFRKGRGARHQLTFSSPLITQSAIGS